MFRGTLAFWENNEFIMGSVSCQVREINNKINKYGGDTVLHYPYCEEMPVVL